MTYQGWDPYRRFVVTGTLVKQYGNGITIDDARGVRWFIATKLVIGEVKEA